MTGRPTRRQRHNAAIGIDVGTGAYMIVPLVTGPIRYYF
jgi:hypothetical protein